METFFDKAKNFIWQQILIGLFIAAGILLEQVRWGVVLKDAIEVNWIAFSLPYLCVFLLILCWNFSSHFVRASP